MNIYTVEIHGHSHSYIGIQESKTDIHAAIRVVADIVAADYELPHDIWPGTITRHPSKEDAVSWYKRKYQNHDLIDPYQEFILNEEE